MQDVLTCRDLGVETARFRGIHEELAALGDRERVAPGTTLGFTRGFCFQGSAVRHFHAVRALAVVAIPATIFSLAGSFAFVLAAVAIEAAAALVRVLGLCRS